MVQAKPPRLETGHFLLGDIVQAQENEIGFYQSLQQQFNDIAIYRYMMKEFYWVNNPDYIKEVLTNPVFERSHLVRRFMGAFLGGGIFTQEGREHLENRNLMLPAFHKKRIMAMGDMFVEYTNKMLDSWSDTERRDLSAEMMALTLAIVSNALFGTDASVNANSIKDSLHSIQDSIDETYPYYAAILPEWTPIMPFGKTREAINDFQNKTRAIIEERRKTNEDYGDLLSVLLLAEDDAGRSMDTETVIGQVASLLFAGHETTANALTWIIYALARNPSALDKLLYEIDTVLEGRGVTMADLGDLPYTRMVIDETLRLYPPAWYTERSPREDVQFGEYTVPAGEPVVITIISTHRDPRYFENPMDFKPERFAPENKDKIQKFTYLPFGSGTHKCMGDNFALMEMQMILATMLQKFTISIDPAYEAKPRPIVTMGVEDGLPATLHAR